MYRLFGQVKSRAMRPLWLLEELGAVFEFVPVMPRSPEALEVNPLGKIPALVVEGEGSLFDSVAMMTYLSDRHGAFTHAPGTYARARQDAFTNTINETFDAVLWAYAKHSFILPEDHRVEAVKPSLRWQFDQYSAVMADLIGEGPYVLGDGPTVPDFLLAHCCGWAAGLKFDLPEPLRHHMNTMRARPAFRKAVAYG